MNRLILLIYILAIISFSCNKSNNIEKYQNKRDNIVNVKKEIRTITTEKLLGYTDLDIIDSILLVIEAFPDKGKGIHLYNKNTFEHITSTAILGKGPGEITRQGGIAVDHKNKTFWVSDHGKMVMWKFPLDSVLQNKNFKPSENRKVNADFFIERYGFVNDSIAIGKAVRLIPGSKFNMAMAKYNFNTDTTEVFGYEHPIAKDKKSNSRFDISIQNGIYVNAYGYCDLITICNLDGTLKYNIYGPGWNQNKNNRNSYYKGVKITDKAIITSYNGGANIILDKYKRMKGTYPTKFLIFDLQGNYMKTLETNHNIAFFCFDNENKRLIINFDDRTEPLGYIDLKNITSQYPDSNK